MNKENLLKQLNASNPSTLMETLGIEYTDASKDFITATMLVNSKVHQPYGLLHGGASVALAETVGSILSAINVDVTKFKVVGMQISSNHLKPVKSGLVTATAKFLRKGRTSHLVEIKIVDEQQNQINHTLLTNAIIPAENV